MVANKKLDKQIIDKKLAFLEESLTKIERMDLTFDMITGDEDIQDLLDRRMQMAIEACIDIATHLAAGLKLPRQESTRDIFLLLGENGVISKELAQKMGGAAGLRNIIVHEYADIDYQLAYFDLDKKVEDLRQFAEEVCSFMEGANQTSS